MKLQYLGDSKDAFKWDYLDFLTRGINAPHLDIIPLKTEPDETGQGKTSSSRFPASNAVKEFCRHLRKTRSLGELLKLPRYTGAEYKVRLHNPSVDFIHAAKTRASYFSKNPLDEASPRILFIDPDIGFQPAKTANENHIKYSDMAAIWPRIADDALVCIFQHGRRMYCPFKQHYAEITRGLQSIRPLFSTTVYWRLDLMFVPLGKTTDRIGEAREVNGAYKNRPRTMRLIVC